MKEIIRNQARWVGYAEIAEGAKKQYDDYLKDIFKVKEPPKIKWYQFFRKK